MAYAIHDAGEPGMSGRPSRRSREQVARTRSVRFDLSEVEYAEISAAAVRCGQSRGAYAAVVTLAAARGLSANPGAAAQQAVQAVDRAALQVRKNGINLNQAVARLHATGQPTGDLPRYAEQDMRLAARLEAMAEELLNRLLPSSTRRRRITGR